MYTIVTDSCCDLNPNIIRQYEGLDIVPLCYTIGGETRPQPIDDEAAVRAYYARLRAGEVSTTSQVPPAEWQERFEAHIQNGEQVLCLVFSSGLSGTCASAFLARDMVLEAYPDAVIEVVDTLNASAGQGMMVYDALRNREAGMDVHENAAWMREHTQRYAAWFTVDDLMFLKRGGRCSPSAAFFGSMLSIKPVLHVNAEGKLIARSKVRGRQQALRALVQKMKELNADKDQVIFISHGDCEEDAKTVKQRLVETMGCDPDRIIISMIGPVIGGHSGPGTVALFFRGKDRG